MCILERRPGPPIPAFVQNGVSEEEAKKLVVKAIPLVNSVLGKHLHESTSLQGKKPLMLLLK